MRLFAPPVADPDREQLAGDHLPYAGHLDESTLLLRDGKLMQILQLRGLPFETSESEELNYRKALRETMLRSIATSRFALYHHVVRRQVEPRLPGQYEPGFAQDLDRAWTQQLAERRLYVNELYLTIVRRPLQGHAGWFERLLSGSLRVETTPRIADDLQAITAASDSLRSALAPYGARQLKIAEGPNGAVSEPLGLLSLLYNGERRTVRVPEGDLGQFIPYRRVSFGADALELAPTPTRRAELGAIVSLKDYPSHTTPGMLDDLLRLPYEMVLTESFGFVDRQGALERMKLTARRMRAASDEATSLRYDLEAAQDDVASGRSAFGEHHLSLLVKAESFAELDSGVADISSALTEAGVISVREDVNLEAAFWAQFPGNMHYIGRRALLSTMNFASFASLHNFPTGQGRGSHWGEAVSLLETTSAGPYFFNFHQRDLGNFTVIGPSGSGKTVVLGFLLAQAQKFQPRTVYFDKDRGAEIFIRALGGRYDVIRPGEPTGFNPLQLEDTPINRRFLVDWLTSLISAAGPEVTAEDLAQISEAIDANFAQPARFRRLRFLAELFRGGRRPHALDLCARLAPWHSGGDQSWLFDNAEDGLDLGARTLGFDLTSILDHRAARTPVMMYLFHRVEQRLDGSPSIIVIDEGWKALDDEVFVEKIRDWEKTIRKRNGILGFCTQSAQDALTSKISTAIIEQSATNIFTINPKAQSEDYCDGFGLSSHELELVRSLPDTSHCFLIKHGKDSVIARLNLSGMQDVLTVLSGRESTVRRLDALRAKLGDQPVSWLPELVASAP